METHILSLAKALKQRGYFVAVASAGGSLKGTLASLGILHIYLPLDERRLSKILLSRKLLKEALAEYRFDVLHAHSRLAAFVVSSLPKSLRRHFVTTAHLDFEVTPLIRFFSRWGEKTLAVSEDIRAYLVREYALSYRRVGVTVNGIDTERFVKTADSEGLVAVHQKERMMDAPKEKIILHISRMDQDRAATAFLLCDILPTVRKSCNAKLILVGGGELLGALEKRVADDLALRGVVSVVGEAVDILPYLQIADVFVGVSRAALEAMSCGIPTVLAGNSGYLGIYRDDKFAEAASSNFCCRGAVATTATALCQDLLSLLCAEQEMLDTVASECRKTVLCHYSLDRMVQDAEALYVSFSDEKASGHNLILGYHGFGNLGDDLLLEKMIEGIQSIDAGGGISVISHNAKATACEFSVHAVSRKNLPGIFWALIKARVLYVGGGTILQKETSRRSFWYYAFWIRLAKLFGKQVVYYANGLDRVSRKEERALACLLKGKCVVTLRDAESYRQADGILQRIRDEKKPYLAQTADSALVLQPLLETEAKCLFAAHGLPTDQPYFVLALSGNLFNKKHKDMLLQAILLAMEKGFCPIFLLMQPDVDAPLAKALAEALMLRVGKKAATVTLPPQGALSLVASCAFLLTSRFHALVFGAMASTPMLCLSQSEKCRRFCEEIGVDNALLPKAYSEEELLYALASLMGEPSAYIGDRERVKQLALLAETTPEVIRKALDQLSDDPKKIDPEPIGSQDHI